MSLEQKVTQAWYQDQTWIRSLLPLSGLYRWGLGRRRKKVESLNRSLSVPVVIVGNITVGGTGKTPLIIHLCEKLAALGISVGVISRGYGAKANRYPYSVSRNDSTEEVGDEPLMICNRLGIPVVIDPDRYAAAEHMINTHQVDVILSDDGMQHFGLPRDLEILVVDASRELGNELLLPAGPLREPVERLRSVDFCLINGQSENLKSEALKYVASGDFCLQPLQWTQISTGEKCALGELILSKSITAIAGIGNPKRFFDTLKSMDIDSANCLALDDHEALTEQLLLRLLANDDDNQILMTSKDAVKCQAVIAQHGLNNCWSLDVGVQISQSVEQPILDAIEKLVKQSRA